MLVKQALCSKREQFFFLSFMTRDELSSAIESQILLHLLQMSER